MGKEFRSKRGEGLGEEKRLNTTVFGVPCSHLKNRLEDNLIPNTSEKEALGMAAGCWFTGKKPRVYMQNSGLGVVVDTVMSLYKPYNIPLPDLLVSVRHSPNHHSYMFSSTYDLLELMEWDNYEQVIQSFRSS